MRENFLTPDLSISGNFEQLLFLWQKSLPADEENFFDTRSIHFRQFWATLVFVAEKPPPPTTSRMREKFWHQIYPFQAILSNFGFVAEKPPPPRMRENFLTPDLSISGNFEELWFCGRKVPSPRMREIFWHQIYPFHAILSNFGFCGRKAPPTPPRMRENFLTPDLSNSGNFEQIWFLWQKSPPPARMRENILTSDLSISGNFEQLWFLWQKSLPPADEENFFDTRSII